jgi:hypothetical protein
MRRNGESGLVPGFPEKKGVAAATPVNSRQELPAL